MGRGWIGWWEGDGGVVVRAGRGEDGRGRRRGGGGGGGGAVEVVSVRERDAIVGEWVSRKCGWLVALRLFTVVVRLSSGSHARAWGRIETLAHSRRATSDHADLCCL
jgi:hypothetical protein